MHVPQTEIILRLDGAELARVTLPPGEYVIGRGREADIRADTPLLSRKHALLTINYDHLLLEDLGSINGTVVGEAPISEPTRLFPNQPVRLGDVTLEVRRERAPDSADVSLAPMQAAVRRALPSEVLSDKRYAISGMVARGGMGAILEAKQNAIARKVAMKVMLDSSDPADALRFIDEAKITGQLEHPNIVPIYELGVDAQDQLFYAMKFVRGITLKKVIDLLSQGVEATVKKYPLPALLTIFQKACDAIAFAHSKGVIHRDLKPENLMLGDFGEVLVMDWGLAKALGKSAAPTDRRRSFVAMPRDEDAGFGGTLAGTVMGTPQYMAPEQAAGEIDALDARTDIYALGAILFEILHLRSAITGNSVSEVLESVRRGQIAWPNAKTPSAKKLPHLPGGRVPESLDAIVRKATALDPGRRYASVEALQADVTAYQQGFATSAETKSAWKQVTLLIKRHRAVSTAIAAAVVLLFGVSSAFTIKVLGERNRANRALSDLRQAAPTLAAEARKLIDEQKFDDALVKIRFACEIDRENADYRLLLAQLLQARLELQSAAEEFRRVLAFGPDGSARANLALCEQLLRDYPPPAPFDNVALQALYVQMEKERRFTQAAPIAVRLGKSRQAVDAVLQARLVEWRKIPGWDKVAESERYHWHRDGSLRLNFDGTLLNDVTSVRGLPIYNLGISFTRVADLSPLAGLRLRELYIAQLDIRDLSPLRDMPLEVFDAGSLKAKPDLKPLAGMRLRTLMLTNFGRRDFSILSGMPLSDLNLSSNSFTDLAFLAGAPITRLVLDECHALTDISALRSTPLKYARFVRCKAIRDFRPLLDCPALERVALPRDTKEIEVLRRHAGLTALGYDPAEENWKPPAEFWAEFERWWQVRTAVPDGKVSFEPRWGLKLDLAGKAIRDVSPLRSLPIDNLSLYGTQVTDLTPLRGMRLKLLTFDETAVTDVSPLLDLPILEAALVTRRATNLEALRQHPTLKYLGWEGDWSHDGRIPRPKLTTAEFWKRYDAESAAGKK